MVTDVSDLLGAGEPASGDSTSSSVAAPAIDGPPPPALTPRQHEILQLLTEGRSNEDIARVLGLSRTTVRNHTSGLYARLGVRSRLEAVAVARRIGVVD